MMFIVPYVSPDYLFWKCSLHAVYVELGQIWNYGARSGLARI